MAKLIAVEGIGGSGKTTLINYIIPELLNGGYSVKHIREARNEPTDVLPAQLDSYYLSEHLRTYKDALSTDGIVIFDRCFLATLAIMYARVLTGTLDLDSFEGAKSHVDNSIGRGLDNLLICATDTQVAIDRRNRREGSTHPLWSDLDMMIYASEFYRDHAAKYAQKTIIVDTSNPLTSEEIHDFIEGCLPRLVTVEK